MGPAVVGTLLITGAATVMAVPLGILGGIYLNEYSARTRARPGHPLPRRGHDRRPVDRDGAVHLLDLGAALRGLRLRRCARARVPDAPGRHPDDRGDAQARGPGAPAVRVRARRSQGGNDPARRAPAPRRPGSSAARCSRVARAAGETAPLLFTILTVNETNTNLFHGPNTTLSVQIFRNAQQVFPGPQERAWGAALDAHRHRVHLHPALPRPLGPVREEAPRMSLVDDRSQPMDHLDVTPTNVAPVTEGVDEPAGVGTARSSSRSATDPCATGRTSRSTTSASTSARGRSPRSSARRAAARAPSCAA